MLRRLGLAVRRACGRAAGDAGAIASTQAFSALARPSVGIYFAITSRGHVGRLLVYTA